MSYIEKVYNAQQLGNSYLTRCCDLVEEGMDSSDILQIITSLDKEFNVERHWHKPQIRIGKNTILGFGRSSGQDFTLQKDDLYFIDLGLVIDGIESDQAITNSTGISYEAVALSGRKIWDLVYDYWQNNIETVSGIDLYQKASELALELGLNLDLSEGGHRIGPFPHDRQAPNDLKYVQTPVPNGEWILEIKTIDFKNCVGAFHENSLVVRS